MSDAVNRPAAVLPSTRSLPELIAACEVVASEHAFQAHRLEEHVTPRTEDERRHHLKLKADYEAAAETTRQLKRYHERRLKRAEERGGSLQMESMDHSAAIDAAGRATAYTDDDDAPV